MKKYNKELFWAGFLMSIAAKLPLLLTAVVLCIAGIWKTPLLVAAVCIFLFVLLSSLTGQLGTKHAVEHNDNKDFQKYADAMMSENWREKLEEIEKDRLNNSDENDTK